MTTLYVIDRHEQLLYLWHEMKVSHLDVVHLDFHCDMRGLLIDRLAQRAYRTSDIRSGIDQGNFLTHAILEGLVSRLLWVHDVPGGRRDDVGTVQYATDFTGRPELNRLQRQGAVGQPLQYTSLFLADWVGPQAGQFLDIDWDLFACRDYPIATIYQRAEAFFDYDLSQKPTAISLCYSPDYVYPTRPLFERFTHRLAEQFQADIVRLPPPPPEADPLYKRLIPKPAYAILRESYYYSQLWLRQRGIF